MTRHAPYLIAAIIGGAAGWYAANYAATLIPAHVTGPVGAAGLGFLAGVGLLLAMRALMRRR